MLKLVLLFAAAGLGGVLRYAISGWAQGLTQGPFPVGTLLVNVLGCLAIGFLAAAFAGPVLIREDVRIAILIGLLGGFTTFSTFGQETFGFVTDRGFGLAAANLLLMNGLGLLAVWSGTRLAEHWYGV
jgi:CrcB protein